MQEKIVSIGDSITVGELAETLNLSVVSLVGELFKNGIAATVNQRIDFETASIIVEELGVDATLERKKTDGNNASNVRAAIELSESATERPPIVAVMGHVDHGKTSLLDAILSMKVAHREAGGITQHISAYQTSRGDRSITLLDTPGHEAFAALRQHGAVLTDVVVIVVAADDGVKPQTIEAIRFARNANARIVVAINKIDKETANPQLVRTQLASEHGLNPEEWGGDVIMVEVSAKSGTNIDKLLDSILLVADMEELKADNDASAEGLVIEARTERGKGSVVGLLVEQGSLKPQQFIVAGTTYGKVRTMIDFKGDALKLAGPSTPATVTGFKELPQFGDVFYVVKTEKDARQAVQKALIESQKAAASTNVTGADILKMMTKKHEASRFNVIVKADVQGSLTSVVDSLKLIDTGNAVDVNVIGSGVGNISENDIRLAIGEDTVVYGFNVEMTPAVKQLAARNKVPIRMYKVIYEILDNAKESMEELLAPKVVETVIGSLEVKGVFMTARNEIIAGGQVLQGKIYSGLTVRVVRKNETLPDELEVTRVQRMQQEAKEVFEGEMCGLSLKTSKKVVLEEGDRLEMITRELVKQFL